MIQSIVQNRITIHMTKMMVTSCIKAMKNSTKFNITHLSNEQILFQKIENMSLSSIQKVTWLITQNQNLQMKPCHQLEQPVPITSMETTAITDIGTDQTIINTKIVNELNTIIKPWKSTDQFQLANGSNSTPDRTIDVDIGMTIENITESVILEALVNKNVPFPCFLGIDFANKISLFIDCKKRKVCFGVTNKQDSELLDQVIQDNVYDTHDHVESSIQLKCKETLTGDSKMDDIHNKLKQQKSDNSKVISGIKFTGNQRVMGNYDEENLNKILYTNSCLTKVSEGHKGYPKPQRLFLEFDKDGNAPQDLCSTKCLLVLQSIIIAVILLQSMMIKQSKLRNDRSEMNTSLQPFFIFLKRSLDNGSTSNSQIAWSKWFQGKFGSDLIILPEWSHRALLIEITGFSISGLHF